MQTEAPLRADEASSDASAGVNPQVTAFFETLRREQSRYLDAVGNARGLLGPEHVHLAQATAIQLRLTRRMFDAQRSIVTHRAEIDAELAAIRREVGLPDDTFVAGLPDTGSLERGFDALLDDWWQREQVDRRLALHESASVDVAAWAPPTAPTMASPVVSATPAATPTAAPTSLPGDLLAALDAADPAHLDALFTSLAEALTSEVAPSPAVVPYTFDDLIIRLEPSDAPTSLEALLGPPTTWERVGTPALEQLQWMLTRVLLPISLVTGSLALAMAWVG